MTRHSMRARRGALATALAVLVTITAGSTTATAASAAGPSGTALPACTKTWTNTSGGDWDTAAGWSGGTVPTSTDHVCITTSGTYTVTFADGAPVVVASLRVGNPEPGADTQRLVVERGADSDATALLATQGIEIRSRGVVELGESDVGTVSLGVGDGAEIANAGRLAQVTGQTDTQIVRGDVVTTGEIEIFQPIFIEGDLVVEAGHLQIDHVLHVRGEMWTKAGEIDSDGWLIAVYGHLRVGAADTDPQDGAPVFTVDGDEAPAQLTFEDDTPIDISTLGAVSVTGDTAPGQDIDVNGGSEGEGVLTFSGTWTNRGRLNLEPVGDDGARVAGAEDGDTLVNEGELERFGSASAAAVIDANLVNRGSIATDDAFVSVLGGLENEGGIDIGLGSVEVVGDALLDPSSAVGVTIDGVRCCTPLSVGGDLTVDGRLDVETGTAPAVGAVTLLAEAGAVAGALTGTFDELTFAGPASYDAHYTATEAKLVRRASETATRRFVRAAFQDFLGRQPDSKELSNNAGVIDSGNGTRASLVRSLSQSEQYVTALVQRFYADTLGRPGDPGGVTFWVDQLISGRKTVAEVAGSFYASSEYFTRAGGTNAAWITDLYEVFFDRPPTGGDLTYWTGRIAARGRTRVAIELFQSLESRRQRVQRLYQDLLGRDGDPDGVDYWAGRITAAGDLALAVNLASSAEYLARAQTRYP